MSKPKLPVGKSALEERRKAFDRMEIQLKVLVALLVLVVACRIIVLILTITRLR